MRFEAQRDSLNSERVLLLLERLVFPATDSNSPRDRYFTYSIITLVQYCISIITLSDVAKESHIYEYSLTATMM